FVTRMVPPRHLPRLEFLEGPPPDFRTFVVVPTLLGGESEIPEQLEKLEVHYLSNPDGDVRFALLTDWPDSRTEMSAEDAKKLPIAVQLTAALNQKHGPAADGGPRFFFFHRKRLWNPLEGTWMGWERKRGKLHEFNRLLRGAADTTYINPWDLHGTAGSPLMVPRGVRYVITLDADTKLPPGVVNQLVGILAHPLHRARWDPLLGKVVEGYGILQPRVTAFLPGRDEKSIFQKLFSGECGIDPYASAVSDLYQDLFGEGSFTGKGIYDVDAYEKSLEGRIPENRLLSHDLFEGSFARCGYASDLEFFEEFPSHAEISTARNHRWIRGDWQLLPWIFGRSGASLSTLARWKMMDNLRRSLSPIGTVGLFLTAFCLPATDRRVWAGLALLGMAFPSVMPFWGDLAFWRGSLHWKDRLGEIRRDLLLGAGQFIVNLVLVANRCWIHLDAITRTLWRLFVSHRDFLEWVTAAQANSSSSLSQAGFWRRMKGSLSIALLAALSTALLNPRAWPTCLPFVLLWLSAPWFAWWISLPESRGESLPLGPGETGELRLYARRIWRFFAQYASAEDHFLPPDNFQEDPEPVVAHRSSPTNFGLHLLSIVTARDFGWCGWGEMADRLEAALKSLGELPRFRGHFFNWVDTRSLLVLEPRYISTVDSGNLAGHLLTLSQACRDLAHRPLFSTADLAGIKDSVTLLKRAAQELPHHGRTAVTPLSQLQKEIGLFEEQLDGGPHFTSHPQWAGFWDKLDSQSESLRDTAYAFASDQRAEEKSEIIAWADLVADNVKSHARDFRLLFPWVYALSDSAPPGAGSPEEADFRASLQKLLSDGLTLAATPGLHEKAIESFESLRRSRSP
ncbi:MAG TPA: phosphorylase, partial [bacterium]|nr:phosphorylase [bacterium]